VRDDLIASNRKPGIAETEPLGVDCV